MFDASRSVNRKEFLKIATYFEGSLVVAAYGIGWMADVNPLGNLSLQAGGWFWGLAGTVPLYVVFLLSYHYPVGELRAIKSFLVERMGPMLDACHWTELLYLGLLAGFTEEALFRGLLQPLLESHWGWLGGLILSNILFAAAHSITPLYALLAGLTGLYLGCSMDFGGERNLLTPMLIHSVYDFLAFVVVAKGYRLKYGMAC